MKRLLAFSLAATCSLWLVFNPISFASTQPQLPAAASTATPQPAQDLSKQLDGYFTKLTKDLDFSGSVLIARDGKVLLSKGYGWVIDQKLDRNVIEHGGGIEGFRTEIMRFPDERVTAIVLSNREQLDPYEIATGAAKMIFGEV